MENFIIIVRNAISAQAKWDNAIVRVPSFGEIRESGVIWHAFREGFSADVAAEAVRSRAAQQGASWARA